MLHRIISRLRYDIQSELRYLKLEIGLARLHRKVKRYAASCGVDLATLLPRD